MIYYFYGQNNKYGFLSNFYSKQNSSRPLSFKINASVIGLSYEIEVNTAEKGIMWLKALLMGDLRSAYLISINNNPGECKAMGRKITPFNEELWLKYRDQIAIYILTMKFKDNELRQLLLNTGNDLLVEASPSDCIWGIGISVDDAYGGKPWKGKNLLGNSLMIVRENIRKEITKELIKN